MRSKEGIPTLFKGIEYRSLHEAKWAVFMFLIGWEATYEPFEGDGYIPDFIVHGESAFFLEVKPAVTKKDYEDEVPKVEKGLLRYKKDALIVGAHPLRGPVSDYGWGNEHPSAGWMGEFFGSDEYNPQEGFSWDPGAWTQCGKCGAYAIFHTVQTYTCRPCGHYFGDHYLRHPDVASLEDAWAEATNAAKYRHKKPR